MSLHLREFASAFQQVSSSLFGVVPKSSSSSSGQRFSYVYETEPGRLYHILVKQQPDITGNLIDGLFENDKYRTWFHLLQKIGQFLKMVWLINFVMMPNGHD